MPNVDCQSVYHRKYPIQSVYHRKYQVQSSRIVKEMHIEAGVNCVNDQIASLRRSLCELRQDPIRQSTNESKKYLHRNRNELRQAINAKMPEGSRYAIWTEYVHWSLGELCQATNVKEADVNCVIDQWKEIQEIISEYGKKDVQPE